MRIFARRRGLASLLIFLASTFSIATIAPVLMDSFIYMLLVEMPCLVALFVGFLWAVVLVIRALVKRDWLVVVILSSCCALSGWLSFKNPIAVLQALTRTGHFIKFAFHYPAYQTYVESLPRDGKGFKEWNWGGPLFASDGVTYDETDEVGLSTGQSTEWIRRFKNTDLMCGGDRPFGAVEHLWGHYYFTDFGC